MNRKERRSKKKDRFLATCKMCESFGHHTSVVEGQGACVIHVITRHGKEELGICKGCPCATGTCDQCGETGQHWLGCAGVGIPEMPKEGVQH